MGVVDRHCRDRPACASRTGLLCTAPAPERQRLIMGDLGQQLDRPETLEQQLNQPIGIISAGMMITDVDHVARRYIAQLQ